MAVAARRLGWGLGCAVALVVVLASSPAWAGRAGASTVQGNPATQVPRVADGPGLEFAKNSVFHGGAALAVGFDSNVFSEPGDRPPQRAAHGTPSLWLSIGNRPLRNGVLDSPAKPSGRKVDYYLGVLAGWRLYMTGRRSVWQASRLNANVAGRVVFAPGRRFSFAIDEDFNRLGEPTNFEAARVYNFNRIDHSGALRFIWRPSGGRLQLSAAYRNELLFFEPNAADPQGRSNRLVNGIETETRWRFRDRSAVAVRYSYHYNYYFCCVEQGTGRNEDSHAHRVLAGYVGQVGKRFVLDVFAGYGAGLYRQDVNGPNHNNFIGYASIGYFPTPRTQLHLRVSRQFHDSLWGNYFSDAGGALAASHVFRWNMRIDAGFGVYARRFAGLPVPGVETDEIASYTNAPGFVRRDTLISASIQVEQPLGKYFVLGARYALGADLTNFAVEFANGFVQDGRFTRNLLMVFGAVRY